MLLTQEFGLSVPRDVAVPTEGRREIRCDCEIPIEVSRAALRSSPIPLQWAGSLALWTDVLMPLEFAAMLHGDTVGFVELACVTLSNVQLRLELLTILGSETRLASESLSNGARFSVDAPLCLEWADPPSLLILAPERLLRSPGRVGPRKKCWQRRPGAVAGSDRRRARQDEQGGTNADSNKGQLRDSYSDRRLSCRSTLKSAVGQLPGAIRSRR
jgi:hypothetical protein